MYLILEEEIEGRCGDYLRSEYHAIPLEWLGDKEAAIKMEDKFWGFKFDDIRESARGDIIWKFNRLTKQWEKVINENL